MTTRSSLIAALVLATPALCETEYAGVNESGGEFGSNILPGAFGVQYKFIEESTIDTWTQTDKINTFRVPFLLERMCPPATGLGSTFNETVSGNSCTKWVACDAHIRGSTSASTKMLSTTSL